MTYCQKYGCSLTGGKTAASSGQPPATASPRDGGEETRALRAARDMDYLFGSFGQFWERRRKILCMPEIYGIYPLFSGLSLAYAGGGPLSLGMLLELWNAGEWRVPCTNCGGASFIYFAGGSPLSGMNGYAARCPACGARIHGRAENFAALWRPAKKLIARAEAEKAAEPPGAQRTQPRPREDFRAMSARWRRDYDEKSETELERAAAERKAREEDKRRRALEAARRRYAALGLPENPLPTETALKMRKNIKEETT